VYESIDHVGIVVADIEKAAAWYEENLGWKLHHEEYVPDAGVFLGFLWPDGVEVDGATSIQLVQPVEPGPLMDFLTAQGEGLHHLCLRVSDISLALRGLSEDLDGIFMGGRGCFLERTPQGVRIELAGPTTALQASIGAAADGADIGASKRGGNSSTS